MGRDQQARQSHAAQFVGGSGDRARPRVDYGVKARLPAAEAEESAAVAKVTVARKLAVRLYWMWRTQQPYSATRMQGSPSHLVVAVKTDPLNGRPASQKLVWESEDNNHGRNNRSNR